MDTSNKQKYLDKIRKLMRLAKGTTNPQEAASAMSKVQAFMREHGLTEADVDLSEVKEASAASPNTAAKAPAWVADLSHLICRAFGVNAYFSQEWRSNGTLKSLVRFYGTGERAEIASYAFEVLGRQLKHARKEYQQQHCRRCKRSTAVARADQFCQGWVYGAHNAIQPFAMTPAEKGQLERYKENIKRVHGLGTFEPRPAKKCRGDDDAAYVGYQQGKEAKLHHGVTGGNPARIGR